MRRTRPGMHWEIKTKKRRTSVQDPAMRRMLSQAKRQERARRARQRRQQQPQVTTPQQQTRARVQQVRARVQQAQQRQQAQQIQQRQQAQQRQQRQQTQPRPSPRPEKPSTVLKRQMEGMPDQRTRGEQKPRVTRVKEQPKVSVPMTRYDKFVERVNSINDIKQLKKIIYNRNYRLKQAYLKEFPEAEQLKYIMVNDLRHIKSSTFKRINKIKDPKKQIEVLRKLIIDTTRRKNKMTSIEDYSNREQEYMKNAIFELQAAINNWDVGDLFKNNLNSILEQVTMADIERLFKEVPSYWAIGNGYYYAVEDFSHFVDELVSIFEEKVDEHGQPIIVFTAEEKHGLKDRLFKNNPSENISSDND